MWLLPLVNSSTVSFIVIMSFSVFLFLLRPFPGDCMVRTPTHLFQSLWKSYMPRQLEMPSLPPGVSRTFMRLLAVQPNSEKGNF